MGGGGSTASGRGTGVVSHPPPTIESLEESGRYIVLPLKGGAGFVHCLGVYPCSARSVQEVQVLLEEIRPQSIYVDVLPEQLDLLDKEAQQLAEDDKNNTISNLPAYPVELRRRLLQSGAGAGAGAGADAGAGAGAGARLGAGGDEEIAPDSAAAFGFANEPALSAALAAARKRLTTPPPFSSFYKWDLGLKASAELRHLVADEQFFRLCGVSRDAAYLAAVEFANQEGIPTRAYPLSIGHRAKEGVYRIASISASIVGAPPQYTHCAMQVGPMGTRPDVAYEIGLPPEGMLSYDHIHMLRSQFAAGIDDALINHNPETADSENWMLKNPDPSIRAALLPHMESLTRQSQVAAHAIQSLEGPDVVAIVDLGRMASLKRAWIAPMAPEDAFPNPPFYDPSTVATYTLPALGLSGIMFATYKGFFRFRKTTILLSIPVYSMLGLGVYGILYPAEANYGTAVRAALANPKQPFKMY